MHEARRLGGVLTFGATADDLVAAVREIQDPQRWTELVRSLPRIESDEDTERWMRDHLDAYHRALPTAEW
jgi:hypothetical protein